MKKPKAKHKRRGAPRIRKAQPQPAPQAQQRRRRLIADPMAGQMSASMALAMAAVAKSR